MASARELLSIPKNARALTAIGDETAAAVERLLFFDTPLFGPVDDVYFRHLAETFSTRNWSDHNAARVLDSFTNVLIDGRRPAVSQLVEWVRAHDTDAAEAVAECIRVEPPADVDVISLLSKRGSQKVVFRASWQGKREVALKKVIGSKETVKRILERERLPHPFNLSHPNIIETLPLTNERGEVFLVEPLLDDVLNDLSDLGGLQNVVTVFIDIANALKYLHDNGYVHGDVKPDNIGRRADDYVLLDFGICRKAEDFTPDTTPTGSLRTRPPEWLLRENFDAEKFDVWALGATVFNFAAGRFPLIAREDTIPRITRPDDRKRFEQIVVNRIRRRWGKWVTMEIVPRPLRGVLGQMLQRHPADRPKLAEVVRHIQDDLAMFIPSRAARERATKKLPPRDELHQVRRFLETPEIIESLPRHRKDALLSKLHELRRSPDLTAEDVLAISRF